MRASIRAFLVALAVVAGSSLFVPMVQAAGLIERGVYLSGPRYDGQMGQCGEALSTIAWQFANKESKFWNSSLQITGYSDVREVAFRP